MSLRWHYAQGKFSEAVGSMAASSRPLRERLETAFLSHLVHLQLSDFPQELHGRYSDLVKNLSTAKPVYKGEGSVNATIRTMHPSKAKKLIIEISSINFSLAQIYTD
ncbi:MAG: hypothetical protein DHS20C05_03910 [Hyphococcus sp.]|nr:MAG: hypothetical protein DHS20C05_03910 [Marinicaulis sp.]